MTSGGRDWDKELAKIDRQMASMSDDQLAQRDVAPGSPGVTGATGAAAAGQAASAGRAGAVPSRAGVLIRVGLAVAVAIGVTIWPYGARCGGALAAYLTAVLVVAGAGAWAALATWQARAGRAHVVSLLVLVWGLALTAVEVLPRTGYAADPARVSWMCP
jgi:hypothetical protein